MSKRHSKNNEKSNDESHEQVDEHLDQRFAIKEHERLNREERLIRAWEQQRAFQQRQWLEEQQQREVAAAALDFSRKTEDEHDEKEPSLFFHVVSPQMCASNAEHVIKAPDTCRCWHCMDAKPHTVSAAVKAAQESERKRIALCSVAATRMRQLCVN